MKMMSYFTRLHVILNPYDYFHSKLRCSTEGCLRSSFPYNKKQQWPGSVMIQEKKTP